MPTFSLHGADIHYEVYGTGEPILLVPGLGGVGDYWAPNIPALSSGHQVVVHDHRGTGRSTKSPIQYSIERMSADVLALMDHLGIAKAHLVGHSTGGAIAQTIAVKHPERLLSVVIYASWSAADPYFRRIFAARRTMLAEAGVAAYVRMSPIFLFPDWWLNDNSDAIEAREALAIASFPPAEIMLSRIDAVLAFDLSRELHRVHTPTLVMCARDDILTPPHLSGQIARAIPGAEFVLLERGGHSASAVEPAAFNAAVLGFIEKL